MYKFVVLFAVAAAVIAEPAPEPAPEPEPGAFIAPSLGYSAPGYLAPGYSYGYQSSAILPSSPLVYSPPLGYSSGLGYSHYIKKRSAPFLASSYITPTTYYASTGLAAAPAYSTPILGNTVWGGSPLAWSAPAHYIKKRSASAQFLAPSTYIAPNPYLATGPLATAYSTPYYGSPYLQTGALAYSTPAHFIKKRSVGLAPYLPSTYIAPSTYGAAPYYASSYGAIASPYYSSPLITSGPLAYSSFIKK